jgi:hypothetical protein
MVNWATILVMAEMPEERPAGSKEVRAERRVNQV